MKFRQSPPAATPVPAADVVVVGGGLAGLTTALACARRGLTVTLVEGGHRGAASRASAGVLGPSIGRGPKGGRVGRFMFAARDRFPGFLDQLRDDTGIEVPVVRGALELALNDTHLAELRTRAAALPDTTVLDASTVAELEGALVPVAGALHHPHDGAVDVRALRAALQAATQAASRITVVRATAASILATGASTASATLDDGARLGASHLVVACGAWASGIRGLPRSLPIHPVKGEVAVAADPFPLSRVVFGAGGYLVPRGAAVLVGATSEESGFDAEPTAAGAAALAGTARSLLRDWRGGAAFAAQDAGLRPMTPDGYPVLGRDPDSPAISYACGYSRNGVLVAPLAADCLAALIAEDSVGFDLSAFSVARFGG